jgi:hypothetical protein
MHVFPQMSNALFKWGWSRRTVLVSVCCISSNTAVICIISLVACTRRLLAICPARLDTFQRSIILLRKFLMNHEHYITSSHILFSFQQPSKLIPCVPDKPAVPNGIKCNKQNTNSIAEIT